MQALSHRAKFSSLNYSLDSYLASKAFHYKTSITEAQNTNLHKICFSPFPILVSLSTFI